MTGNLNKERTTTVTPGIAAVAPTRSIAPMPGYTSVETISYSVCTKVGTTVGIDIGSPRYIDIFSTDTDDGSLKVNLDAKGACEYPNLCVHELVDNEQPPGCSFPYMPVTGFATRKKYHPPSPAIPGREATRGSQAQVERNRNAGWGNSRSTSIQSVLSGHYFRGLVPHGIRGAFFGLASQQAGGYTLSEYKHGLILSKDGVVVFENGKETYKLADSYVAGDEVRINVVNGNIRYEFIDLLDGVSFYETMSGIPPDQEGKIYGILYQSTDTVTEASIEALIIPMPSIVDSAQSFYASPSLVGHVEGRQSFISEPALVQRVAGQQSFLSAPSFSASSAVMRSTIPPIQGNSTYDSSLITMKASIPIGGVSTEAIYTPLPLTEIEGVFPPISASMINSSLNSCNMLAVLPSLLGSVVQDISSCSMIATVPTIKSQTTELFKGFFPVDIPVSISEQVTSLAGVMFLMQETLSINDAVTPLVEIIFSINESLQMQDTVSISIDHIFSMFESISINDNISTLIDGLPELGDGPAWVMNIETGATTIYLDYSFNSFFHHDGNLHGVCNSGIYQLQGSSSPAPESYIEYGQVRFRERRLNRIPYWYAAVDAAGKLYLKVEVDNGIWYYKADNNTHTPENQRFQAGRGLLSSFYGATLIAPEGVAIEALESLHFDPVATGRKRG